MRRQTRHLSSGPDRHVPAEGEEDAELSGALRPSAGVLSGVGHGEENPHAERLDRELELCFQLACCEL